MPPSRSDVSAEYVEQLYLRHAKRIADLLGAQSIPELTVEIVEDAPYPAATVGNRIIVNKKYFARRDDGALIHEFTHVIMNAPTYDDTTAWLIEGIADYVRDKLGFQAPWSKARFEKGQARAGFQTTAHFLSETEREHPGLVKALSRYLIRGAFSSSVFQLLCGKTLDGLVDRYEADFS